MIWACVNLRANHLQGDGERLHRIETTRLQLPDTVRPINLIPTSPARLIKLGSEHADNDRGCFCPVLKKQGSLCDHSHGQPQELNGGTGKPARQCASRKLACP
jgi:hypothetical protein